jgi:long-chain acyl-CoA synthetase
MLSQEKERAIHALQNFCLRGEHAYGEPNVRTPTANMIVSGEAAAPRPGSVEYWAAEKPNDIALTDEDGSWSWSEWNLRADGLAAALNEVGLKRGDVLAVRTRTRKEWCLASAAAAKLGCTLLCLNWRLTAGETAYILRDANARAIICDDLNPEHLAVAWDDLPGFVAISIDRPADGFLYLPSQLPAVPPPFHSRGPASLIVYTSGTTGFPKGVVNGRDPSGSANARAEYRDDVMKRGNQQPGDVGLVNVPLHHGMGAGLIHRAIECGNTLVLMRRFDAETSLALIADHKVSFWFAVPTMLQRMAALPREALARYDLRSIRSIMTGTAPVPVAMKTWVVEHFGPCLTEGYGSTETGMITSLAPDEQQIRPASSGRPYRHVDIKIVGADGRRLGVQKTGEILVRTPTTITEYLGTGPLGPDVRDSEGYFRMGDVGYFDEDGYLFITDRVKDMIISGGVNIYPAEIEAALTRHPAVAAAAAIGIPNEEYGEEVLAFFETRRGSTVSEDELLTFCRTLLASYKRPRQLIQVAELPRNTMGKVLKHELRAPYWAGRERRV